MTHRKPILVAVAAIMEPNSANRVLIPLLVLAAVAVTAMSNVEPWHRNPEAIAETVHRSINASLARRELSAPTACGTGNPMDDCWRCDPEWRRHRKKLARCAIGFGRDALGGMKGARYVVTDESDDAVNPRPGTLRYGAIQIQPLWIIFARDMKIRLREELMINSYKTIDARGVNVHISDGPCLTIQGVSHVIIHGLHIHNCVPAGNTMVRDSPNHVGFRTICDGDGISILNSSHLWIDHCSLSRCADGLIDVIDGSTAITISNNLFTDHNEVMLLGSSDTYMADKHMQVTIAFNHFSEGLIQRMPRCRLGYFHIVNNDYTKWGMYAIGGSASPTIYSQGNRFWAPDNPFAKQVTKHEYTVEDVWDKWTWRSVGDQMINGAYFVQSGAGAEDPMLSAKSSVAVRSSSFVPQLTADAGVLQCGFRC